MPESMTYWVNGVPHVVTGPSTGDNTYWRDGVPFLIEGEDVTGQPAIRRFSGFTHVRLSPIGVSGVRVA